MKKAAVVFITLIIAASAAPRTITVDNDNPANFTTIQAAIDDANDGDTVEVQPGTYTGSGNRDIDFNGKAITLRSATGPENCIIDCNGTDSEPHRGFYFHSGEEPNSILDGFTITGGYGNEQGGAIYCYSSHPLITNCNITGNAVNGSISEGGGIYCRSSRMILTNCTITNNSADYTGGGIVIDYYGGNPMIDNCKIIANSATYSGGGIAVTVSYSKISNCIIAGNSAYLGGASYLQSHAQAEFTNCTITGNRATHRGGAIVSWRQAHADIRNSIIWDNATWDAETASIWTYCGFMSGGFARASYSIVQYSPSSL